MGRLRKRVAVSAARERAYLVHAYMFVSIGTFSCRVEDAVVWIIYSIEH
jgi:hypothetical protein